MTLTTSTRELHLEIAHNVRHLGGYETATGAVTSEAIVRAASLHRLTSAGVGALADAGVTVVVDLRSQVEKERDVTPDLAPFGIVRIEAPVFEQDSSPVGLATEFPGYAVVYERMAQNGRNAYRALFETVATSQGTVLFHCAAGKDRTGVASAVLLSLAGVPDATIVEDFTLSEALLAPLLAEWLPRMKERGTSEERARQLMAAKAEDMESFLAHLRTRYGSAEGYLTEIGLGAANISAVRARVAS